MSAWLFALAGWVTVVIGAWRWAVQYRDFMVLYDLVEKANGLRWKAVDKADYFEHRFNVYYQQALDDRATADALREELQRMRRERNAR